MSNEQVLFAALALAAVFFLGMGYFAARLFSDREEGAGTVAPMLRYRPVKRLLAEEDFEYLSRQAGADAGMLRQLRKRRAKVLGGYLKQMGRDFAQLHLALRRLTVSAGHDRPEIGRALLEQQFIFRLTMARAELRLAFYWMGVKPLDLRPVVDVLEKMQAQVGELSHQTAAAASRA